MNRILLFYALAGLLALVVSQGFIESYWEMELGQAQLLFSRCRQTVWKAKEKGHLPFYRSTVLELGRCYGNDNGKLKRQNLYATSPLPPTNPLLSSSGGCLFSFTTCSAFCVADRIRITVETPTAFVAFPIHCALPRT